MWVATGKNIQMSEGDYGIPIPIRVKKLTFNSADSVKVTIKIERNGATILSKDYGNIQDNIVPFSLTAAESAKLKPGQYIYILDWYRDGTFLYNLVDAASFKVVDKG